MPANWTDLLTPKRGTATSPQNDYIARMLMEQGMDQSPIQSPFQGLARLAQAYVGKQRLDGDMAHQQEGNQALADILAPPETRVDNGPTQTAPLAPQGPGPAAPSMPPQGLGVQAPNIAPSVPDLNYSTPQISQQVDPRNAQIAQLLNGGIGQDTFAKQAMAQLGFGPPEEYGDTPRYDQNGNAFLVGKRGTVKILDGIKSRDKLGRTNNNVLYDEFTGDEKGRLPDTDSAAKVEQQKGIRAAGRPQMSVNVSADRSFGTQLGENAGKILDASHSAAVGGVQTLTTTKQIKDAIATGKVTAGPGASAIQFFNQIAGGDPQKVVETRKTIQGLAQLTMAGRSALKGQGQISDYEGKLLAKASSGDIDSMTAEEIKTVADVADRNARISIRLNRQNVDKARKAAPGNQELVDFYNVDEPPEYVAPGKKSGRFTIEPAGN